MSDGSPESAADLWDQLCRETTVHVGSARYGALHEIIGSWQKMRLVHFEPAGLGCRITRIAASEVCLDVGPERDGRLTTTEMEQLKSLLESAGPGTALRLRLRTDKHGACMPHEWNSPRAEWQIGKAMFGLREGVSCIRTVPTRHPHVGRGSRGEVSVRFVSLVPPSSTEFDFAVSQFDQSLSPAYVDNVESLGREVAPSVDVVYILAHGSVSDDGPLLGPTQDAGSHWLDAASLFDVLRAAGAQVAVLWACNTADENVRRSMASQLQRMGIGLAVGFFGQALASSSGEAVGQLHRSLLECIDRAWPVDLSVQRARLTHRLTDDRALIIGYLHPDFDGIVR